MERQEVGALRASLAETTIGHRLVIGTCGHVDHGKTTLVKALTGIDCDRLAEEKARGITIDLGFAHLSNGLVQIGFVDVPGHERFLHNALAGLGGIRAMLLVVAADEGVKPQTREHLDICSLLRIPQAIVALTKCDRVEREAQGRIQSEIERLLEDTPYRRAPIFPVSSHTGAGLDALRAALLTVARAEGSGAEPVTGPLRLPIDRAFHLKGLGATVTGTLVTGVVRTGDALELLPEGRRVRVRSVHVHSQPRAQAFAGERTSLLLNGVELDALQRGKQLVEPSLLRPTRLLCARFRLLADAPSPLRGTAVVRFHLYSAEVEARLRPVGVREIAPGEEGLVLVRLGEPLPATRGDRYVVRRASPPLTLGGGEVLDPAWAPVRRNSLAAAVACLQGTDSEAIEFWVVRAGERGLDAQELSQRLGLRPENLQPRLQATAAAGRFREAKASNQPPRWLAETTYHRVGERARSALREFFAEKPFARGMPRATMVGSILPGRGSELADAYLAWLEADKVLVQDRDVVNLPVSEAPATKCVLERFRSAGLTPPTLAELEQELPSAAPILPSLMGHLVQEGHLVRLPNDGFMDASAVARVREDLQGWNRFTVPEFKERFGLTRKWALPILEHLDSVGATQRAGNERLVVRP